jgi:lipoprotein signal peptidase
MKTQEKALAIGAIIAGMAAAWYLMQKKALSQVQSASTTGYATLVTGGAGNPIQRSDSPYQTPLDPYYPNMDPTYNPYGDTVFR